MVLARARVQARAERRRHLLVDLAMLAARVWDKVMAVVVAAAARLRQVPTAVEHPAATVVQGSHQAS